MASVVRSPALLLSILMGLAACASDPPYQPCDRENPCGGSETRLCLSSTSATGNTVRFCTLRCNTPAASSTECPDAAACIRLNGGDAVCVPRCTAVAQCPFPNAQCTALPESLGATVCNVRP